MAGDEAGTRGVGSGVLVLRERRGRGKDLGAAGGNARNSRNWLAISFSFALFVSGVRGGRGDDFGVDGGNACRDFLCVFLLRSSLLAARGVSFTIHTKVAVLSTGRGECTEALGDSGAHSSTVSSSTGEGGGLGGKNMGEGGGERMGEIEGVSSEETEIELTGEALLLKSWQRSVDWVKVGRKAELPATLGVEIGEPKKCEGEGGVEEVEVASDRRRATGRTMDEGEESGVLG